MIVYQHSSVVTKSSYISVAWALLCQTKPSNYQQRPEVHIASRIKFLGNGAKMPEDGDHFSLEAIKPNDPTTARYDDSDSASREKIPRV